MQAPAAAAEALPGGEDPLVTVERREEFARLAALLERLGERERELVALKFGAGWTNRAIARALGLSETNVGTLLYRTIQALRAGWNEGES